MNNFNFYNLAVDIQQNNLYGEVTDIGPPISMIQGQ